MSSSMKFVGLAGSLRAASYSRSVLRAIFQLLPDGTEAELLDIGELPHYDEDLERGTLPASVGAARALIGASNAVIIVTPEFNHGLPGVLKNTLDWLSRPAFTSCMVDKPVFFVTLSPGALGGVRAQYQLRETLASMLCKLVPLPEIAITHVGRQIADGQLTDPLTRDFIGKILQRFLEAAQLVKQGIDGKED